MRNWLRLVQRVAEYSPATITVSVSQCLGAFINADEAHDQHQWPKPHFYPPFTDIQLNLRGLVNKMMLEIKEH
jgi:hypothetical protein